MLRLNKETLEAMTKKALVDHVLTLQAELDRLRAAGSVVTPRGPGPDTWQSGGGGGSGGGSGEGGG